MGVILKGNFIYGKSNYVQSSGSLRHLLEWATGGRELKEILIFKIAVQQ